MIWKEEKERKELISYWHTLCFTLDTDDNYFFGKHTQIFIGASDLKQLYKNLLNPSIFPVMNYTLAK